MAKLTKTPDSYDEYRLVVSWAELNAFVEAVGAGQGEGAVADELANAVRWYMDGRVPGPGQDEKDLKDEKDGGEPKADELGLDTPDGAGGQAAEFTVEEPVAAPAPGEGGSHDGAPDFDDELPLP